MRSLAALLAAVLVAVALAACDDDGAEPGASEEATLVLDFQPNAVHTGIYTALRRGFFEDEGIDLEVREPSASTDAPKLLQAGRTDFAVMDINDVGIAREHGLDVVAIGAIVQRPLAAVIASDREAVRRPRDLEGGEVGVTGLPSDDAVLDAVLETDLADPATVRRVTIGFDAVVALSAGRLDAATAFWNAEGVALRRLGVPIRVFRAYKYGVSYPELLLVRGCEANEENPELRDGMLAALERAYSELAADPASALNDLLTETRGLDRAEQEAQLDALTSRHAFGPGPRLREARLANWRRFALRGGIVESRDSTMLRTCD